MYQSVPKPWTGSSSTASWAPIRAPTKSAPVEAAAVSAGPEMPEKEMQKVSLPNESSLTLVQAIEDLDSVLCESNDNMNDLSDAKEENNNEQAKISAQAVQEVDELTRQLMEALDTNEVIEAGDKPKESPFGKFLKILICE